MQHLERHKTCLTNLIYYLLFFSSALCQAEMKLIEFEMEDQFENSYTSNSWNENILIFIAGDRKGSSYNRNWAIAINNEVKKNPQSVKLIGLADLGSVPFFLTGIVKAYFPDDTNEKVLLDWDGLFAETYDFTDDHCNILIFDTNRELIYKTAVTQFDQLKMSAILNSFLKNSIVKSKLSDL